MPPTSAGRAGTSTRRLSPAEARRRTGRPGTLLPSPALAVTLMGLGCWAWVCGTAWAAPAASAHAAAQARTRRVGFGVTVPPSSTVAGLGQHATPRRYLQVSCRMGSGRGGSLPYPLPCLGPPGRTSGHVRGRHTEHPQPSCASLMNIWSLWRTAGVSHITFSGGAGHINNR
jgi:hypothetical protein